MAAKKIPVAAIEQLQRALESVPECHIQDVSKMQAVGMLAPQIRSMRAKGYGWKAIAELLSESGIEVTAVTLKSYLNQTRTTGGKSVGRRSKPPGASTVGRSDAQPLPARSPDGAPEVLGGSRVRPAGGERKALAVEKGVTAPVVTPPAKGALRSGDEGAPRRSAFLPKEDSKDI